MTARFIVGDTRAVTASLPDGSADLIMSSPPYFRQRSYLPDGHPLKPYELGSEEDPLAFVNLLLDLTAEWRRILNPKTGSIVIELGDKYADADCGEEAPDDKSACCTAELYRSSLAWGWRPFSRDTSPAGRWQIRNTITRCSPNPPVGSLGKKWRPATTDLAVATPDDDKRYWDDVATRTPVQHPNGKATLSTTRPVGKGYDASMSAGAPLLDWWNLLQNRIDRALQLARNGADGYTAEDLFGVTVDKQGKQKETPGGKLIREAWQAGEIDLGDLWPTVAGGYPGAHYAVYPPELCEPFIEAMCPRRVCLTCGEPSRRETEPTEGYTRYLGTGWGDHSNDDEFGNKKHTDGKRTTAALKREGGGGNDAMTRRSTTTGWTTCGCPSTDGIRLDGYHTGTGWRPGIVLDPFAGTGTTLAVATGHGRDAIGIDLDPRNADLALQRVGPLLLTVEHHESEPAA